MKLNNLLLPEIEKLDIFSDNLKSIIKQINLSQTNNKIQDIINSFLNPQKVQFKYAHNYTKTIKNYEEFENKLTTYF